MIPMLSVDSYLLQSVKVVSFDLFDTLFFRMVSKPSDIFCFVGEEFGSLLGFSPARFRALRIKAERDLKIYNRLFRRKVREAQLDEIYQLLCKRLRLGDESRTKLMEKELEIERELIYINREVGEFVELCRCLGKTVVFTSDMYLPGDFIFSFLKNNKLCDDKECLYLSSTLNMTKRRDGSLYAHVLQSCSIEPGEMLHIGDNPECDYRIPLSKNIKAVLYRPPKPAFVCRMRQSRDNHWISLLQGLSLKSDLGNRAQGIEEEIGVLGAYIVGPVLFSYVSWLLQHADEHGIKVLYFLARDGQILSRIAEAIIVSRGYSIKAKYLYASRQAWILPSIADPSNISDERAFFNFAKDFTIKRLLERLKLIDETDIVDLICRELNKSIDDRITVLDLHSIKRVFLHPQVEDRLGDICKRELNTVVGYLRQEGWFEQDCLGIVDVGWRGTLQRAVRRISKKSGARPFQIVGYYFDLFEDCKDGDGDLYLSFSRQTDNLYKNGLRGELEIMMELFTYATHESICGYCCKGDGFQPVLMPENFEAKIGWGLEALQTAVMTYTQIVLQCVTTARRGYDKIASSSMRTFFAFMRNPAIQLVRKLAQFPYNTEMVRTRDEYSHNIASPYRLGDIREMVRRRHIMRINDGWVQGSLALTENPVTRLMFSCFYKFLGSTSIRRLERKIRRKLAF
jgi:predicted HAD superfamily hydrolase